MSALFLAIALFACLAAEGFFSGSEIALVNADKHKLALAAEQGSRRARLALGLISRPSLFFATTLLGTNIFTVTGSVATALFIIHHFGEQYAPLAILYWPLTLVFGEIVPKSLYQHRADRIVPRITPPLVVVSYILYPLVVLLAKLAEYLMGEPRRREHIEGRVSRADLETIIDIEAGGSSDVRPHERTMISRIFDLAEKRVQNIMTPLIDVVAIPLDATHEEAVRIMEEYEFSRVPVYEGQMHNILGVLTNDALFFADEDTEVRNLVRPAYFVPEEMPLDTLLVAMKRKGEAMAIVVDEYGAARGIVTTEDLLEEVVGEISDEHDEIRPLYKRLGPKRFVVDGRMEIEHANERLKLEIPIGDYETVAGLLIHHFKRIPRKGEQIVLGKFVYAVLRASQRAIHDIEIVAKE